MALFFDNFATPHTHDSLQIIQYSGPPEPKQTSRRNPSKAPSSKDSPKSNTEPKNKEDLVPTSDGVEVTDLTYLVGEGNNEISRSGGGGDSDVGSYDDFAPQNESEGEEFKRTFREGTGDESSNQPAPSENISQENTVDIEDSQPSSDTDSGDSHENNAGTQKGDRLEVSSISTQGRFPTIEDMSSSSSDTDDNDNDDHGNQTVRLTRKRKRSSSTKRHIRSSNTTSKQHFKHNACSVKQRKLSSSGGNPLSNRPSALKLLSAPPCSGYDAKDCYSDGSSDDSSEGYIRHFESNKRPMSTVRPSHSRKHKWERNRNTADEDDEYEVEKILNCRISRKKLQYRVKWLEYKDDPKWYDASNFKNSPHKLRDFHLLNPTSPGPPKRLERWIQCWEQDSDTDDHPDDNKAVD